MSTVTKRATFLAAIVAYSLITFVACAPAHAETRVFAGAWSHHIGTDAKYNETHDFLAIEHGGYVAGTFINSYSERSYVIGKDIRYNFDDHLYGMVIPSMVWGYRDCLGRQAPDKAQRWCPNISLGMGFRPGEHMEFNLLLLGNALAFSPSIKF